MSPVTNGLPQQRRVNWVKLISLGIDLVLIYAVCVWFIGPFIAGVWVSTLLADPVANNARLQSLVKEMMLAGRGEITAGSHLALFDQAWIITTYGKKFGTAAFVIITVLYFPILSKLRCRTIGRLLVDNFTTSHPSS